MTDVEILDLALTRGMKIRTSETREILVFAPGQLLEFAGDLVGREREACAELVDQIQGKCIEDDVDDPSLTMIAFSIRNRGQSNE